MSQAGGGYELVLSGVLFSLAGLWIDRRLDTVPLFTVGLAVLGFVGSVLNIYYRYKRDIAQVEAETAALRRAARHGGRGAAGDGGRGAAGDGGRGAAGDGGRGAASDRNEERDDTEKRSDP